MHLEKLLETRLCKASVFHDIRFSDSLLHIFGAMVESIFLEILNFHKNKKNMRYLYNMR